jgi:hypothetical protein
MREGVVAISLRHGAGPPVSIIQKQRAAFILNEARTQPTIEQDGTAARSITPLQRALSKKGPRVGRFTVWTVVALGRLHMTARPHVRRFRASTTQAQPCGVRQDAIKYAELAKKINLTPQ